MTNALIARRPLAILALLSAGLAPGIPVQGADRSIRVQGRITRPDGAGAAGQTVRLFKTRRGVTLPRFSSGGQVAEAARSRTDADGFYTIDVPRDRSFDDYWVRFYDPNEFDLVQYAVPQDREITNDLRRGETLRIDVTLALAPAWLEIRHRMDKLGEDSPGSAILRVMGLPEREGMGEGPDGPREEWWYHSRGVVYFFRDGKPAGQRRFDPVVAQPLSAASAGGGP